MPISWIATLAFLSSRISSWRAAVLVLTSELRLLFPILPPPKTITTATMSPYLAMRSNDEAPFLNFAPVQESAWANPDSNVIGHQHQIIIADGEADQDFLNTRWRALKGR